MQRGTKVSRLSYCLVVPHAVVTQETGLFGHGKFGIRCGQKNSDLEGCVAKKEYSKHGKLWKTHWNTSHPKKMKHFIVTPCLKFQAGPCSNLRLLLLASFTMAIENQLKFSPVRTMVGSKDMHIPFHHQQNIKSTALCWYLIWILWKNHIFQGIQVIKPPDSTAKPSPPLRKCTNHHLCMFHLRWSHWIADTWDSRSSEGTFKKTEKQCSLKL